MNRARSRRPGTRAPHRRTARDRMWQAMRILRRFTAPELAAAAEAGYHNARDFCLALSRFGYIVVATPKANGKKGGHIIWRLAKDTGRWAPIFRKDGKLWDANIHQLLETHHG